MRRVVELLKQKTINLYTHFVQSLLCPLAEKHCISWQKKTKMKLMKNTFFRDISGYIWIAKVLINVRASSRSLQKWK